jgi:hypothetical protein
LIQKALAVLQMMDQGKTWRQKNTVNIGSCNENYVEQRVSSANVRSIEVKSSRVKKVKHDKCLFTASVGWFWRFSEGRDIKNKPTFEVLSTPAKELETFKNTAI